MIVAFLLLPLLALAGSLEEDLAARAVAANPGLAAVEARSAALGHRARAAGAWPDPVVSLEIANAPVDSFALDRHPMSGLQLRVQQQVRPARWSGLRRDRHEEQARAARLAAEEAGLALKVEVMQAWWTLARVRGLKRLTREQAALADELLASVRVRFETGTVGQYAVLRLEVLRDRLRDDLGDFVQAEAELVAALDAAVGAEGGSYVTPDTIAARPPPEEADWLAIADAHRPALAQLVAERRAAARAATLARVEARPSPTLWAGYRVRVIDTPEDAGTDFASVGIGVPVPSGSARRGRAERTAALDEVAAAEADAEALRDTIERDVTAVLSAWRRAHDKATTYDTRLVPAARAALDAVRADFAVGRAPFASLFEAEVALVELERARLVAAVDTWMARATALAVLGTLPDGPGVQP